MTDNTIVDEAANDKDEFLQYVSDERDALCTFINSLEWNTELRTKIEDFLIAYDQLKERYKAATKGYSLQDLGNAFDAGIMFQYNSNAGDNGGLENEYPNKAQYLSSINKVKE